MGKCFPNSMCIEELFTKQFHYSCKSKNKEYLTGKIKFTTESEDFFYEMEYFFEKNLLNLIFGFEINHENFINNERKI